MVRIVKGMVGAALAMSAGVILLVLLALFVGIFIPSETKRPSPPAAILATAIPAPTPPKVQTKREWLESLKAAKLAEEQGHRRFNSQTRETLADTARNTDTRTRNTLSAALNPDLPASAGCQNGRVVVVNNEAAIWTDMKIEVNGRYKHVADAIGGNDTLRFFPSLFTNSDGARLNLDAVACKSIDIHATVNGERRHWNGAY